MTRPRAAGAEVAAGTVPGDPYLRPPQQARSRATYQRLLDATEALMAEKSFDELTVAAIVERAGLSAGAFYARFRDKESLFRHLEERTFADARATVGRALDGESVTPGGAYAQLVRLTEEFAALYVHRRPVVRALLLRGHTDPGLRARLDALSRETMTPVAQAMRTALAPLGNDDPELDRRLEIALLVHRSALRTLLVFGERLEPDRPLDPARVAAELTAMVAAYLGLARSAAAGAAASPTEPE